MAFVTTGIDRILSGSELRAVPVPARQTLTDTQSNKLVGVRRFDGGRPARHPAGRFAVQNRSRRFCEFRPLPPENGIRLISI